MTKEGTRDSEVPIGIGTCCDSPVWKEKSLQDLASETGDEGSGWSEDNLHL